MCGSSKFTIAVSTRSGSRSAGVNIGIRYALKYYKPKYIAIVNSDLYLKKNALKISIEKLSALENIIPVGAITGKILNENGKAIWQAGGYIKKFSMTGIARGLNERNTTKFSKPEFVGWASGAFSVFPSKVIPILFRGRGVILQRYKNSFCDRAIFFNSHEGIIFTNENGRKRFERNYSQWLAKRGSIGKIYNKKFN